MRAFFSDSQDEFRRFSAQLYAQGAHHRLELYHCLRGYVSCLHVTRILLLNLRRYICWHSISV